jgi:Flp pilus assembly protein TadG
MDDRRGQALAEFALIAPLLFLLLFAVIQIGLAMASQNGLVNGVRDAARRAATYRVNDESIADATTLAAICGTVETQLASDLSSSIPGFSSTLFARTITYEWLQNPDTSQYFVIVHVDASYKNPLYVPLVSFFLDRADGTSDGYLRLDASEQMRVENPSLTVPTTYPSIACPA